MRERECRRARGSRGGRARPEKEAARSSTFSYTRAAWSDPPSLLSRDSSSFMRRGGAALGPRAARPVLYSAVAAAAAAGSVVVAAAETAGAPSQRREVARRPRSWRRPGRRW